MPLPVSQTDNKYFHRLFSSQMRVASVLIALLINTGLAVGQLPQISPGTSRSNAPITPKSETKEDQRSNNGRWTFLSPETTVMAFQKKQGST